MEQGADYIDYGIHPRKKKGYRTFPGILRCSRFQVKRGGETFEYSGPNASHLTYACRSLPLPSRYNSGITPPNPSSLQQ